MTTKKKSTRWMEDGDDAHFSDNPAVRKHHARKRVTGKKTPARRPKGYMSMSGAGSGGLSIWMPTPKHSSKKKTTRKRVASK